MLYYYYLFLAPVAYFLFRFVGRPIAKLLFYRKQGIDCSFVPTLGPLAEFMMSQKLKGDMFMASKSLAKKKPNALGKAMAMGDTIVLNLMDSKLIKELAFNDAHYRKPQPMILKNFMGTGGLAGIRGAEHKRQRQILTSFLTTDFVDSIIPDIVDSARGGVNKIMHGDLKNRVLLPDLELIPGEIIGKLCFGEDINIHQVNGYPLTKALAECMGQVETTWFSPFYWLLGENFYTKGYLPSHRKMMSDGKAFRAACMDLIQTRKKSGPSEKKYLIDLLLETQKKNDIESRMTDEQILDNFIVLLVPGFQNISVFLQSALYLLGKYPEVLQDLREEVKTLYSKDIVPTRLTLDSMDHMTAFIKEVLRCYPPPGGNLPRLAAEDHKLGDIFVKKGTFVKVDPFFNNFHPKLYDEPEKFNYKRWLEKKELDDPYAFLPFFARSRRCPGEHLSMVEFKVILSEFIKSFEDIKINKTYTFQPTIKRRYQPTCDVRFDLKPFSMVSSG